MKFSFSALRVCAGLLAIVALSSVAGFQSFAQEVVGGVTPSKRPATSPRVEKLQRDQAWFQNALRGVTQPYPASLTFLDHQGDWYTPFNRAGMPGFYDLRQLHGARR